MAFPADQTTTAPHNPRSTVFSAMRNIIAQWFVEIHPIESYFTNRVCERIRKATK
jgi:hypothetical protein